MPARICAIALAACLAAAWFGHTAHAQVAVPQLNSTETVAHIDPPSRSPTPTFRGYFDPPAGSGTLGSATDHVAVAAGGGGIWAVESGAARVFRWDGATRAPSGGFSLPSGTRPSDLAYYRNEVYVSDGRAGNVKVYTPSGVLRRTLGLPADLVLTNGTVDQLLAGSMRILGIDVAWQEVWINLVSTTGGRVVLVLDSNTGMPKSAMWHLPRYSCDVPLHDLNRDVECRVAKEQGQSMVGVCVTNPDALVDAVDPTDPVGTAGALQAQVLSAVSRISAGVWHVEQCAGAARRDTVLGADVWDIATVPELGIVVSGCRAIDRGEIATAASVDELDPTRDVLLPEGPWDRVGEWHGCDETTQDGIDGVWGMRWLMSVEREAGVYGRRMADFEIEPDPLPGLTIARRQWSPSQTASQHRDVVYQYREARVEWEGDLKRTVWQRGNRCLTYRVTDADIYVVGNRGEWFDELARGFQKIELRIGGTLIATNTTATGSFCVDLNTVKDSGTYVLELKAYVNNGTKTAIGTNPELRIDNDGPTGHVEADQTLHDVPVVTAVVGDNQQSGVAQVRLEFAEGSGAWQHLCTKQTPDAPDRYTCAWDTNALPDGPYRLRALSTDRSDPVNSGTTAELSVEVDNDRDGDGLRDAQDACPDSAGPPSEDGCPPEPEPAVEDPTEGEGTHDPGDEDYWNGTSTTHDNTETGGWPYGGGGRNAESAGLRCSPSDPVWGEAYFDHFESTDVAQVYAATPAQALLDLLDANLLPVPLSPVEFVLVSADPDRARYVVYREDDPRMVVELMTLSGGWVPYRLSSCGELVPADPITVAPGR